MFDKTEISYTALVSEMFRYPSGTERTKVANLMHWGMAGNQDALAQQGGAVDGKD